VRHQYPSAVAFPTWTQCSGTTYLPVANETSGTINNYGYQRVEEYAECYWVIHCPSGSVVFSNIHYDTYFDYEFVYIQPLSSGGYSTKESYDGRVDLTDPMNFGEANARVYFSTTEDYGVLYRGFSLEWNCVATQTQTLSSTKSVIVRETSVELVALTEGSSSAPRTPDVEDPAGFHVIQQASPLSASAAVTEEGENETSTSVGPSSIALNSATLTTSLTSRPTDTAIALLCAVMVLLFVVMLSSVAVTVYARRVATCDFPSNTSDDCKEDDTHDEDWVLTDDPEWLWCSESELMYHQKTMLYYDPHTCLYFDQELRALDTNLNTSEVTKPSR
jgi:hypothetical protein